MSEYVPTTEDIYGAAAYGAVTVMLEDGLVPDDAQFRVMFNRWLAAHDAEVAAKAWDEGYWQGINGHTGPGNPYRDSGAAEYRKAVQS